MAIIKQTIVILSLISDCIFYHHPIVLAIRRQFCVSLGELDNRKCWESKNEWEKAIRSYDYDLFRFFGTFISSTSFRENAIRALEHEKDKLIANKN